MPDSAGLGRPGNLHFLTFPVVPTVLVWGPLGRAPTLAHGAPWSPRPRFWERLLQESPVSPAGSDTGRIRIRFSLQKSIFLTPPFPSILLRVQFLLKSAKQPMVYAEDLKVGSPGHQLQQCLPGDTGSWALPHPPLWAWPGGAGQGLLQPRCAATLPRCFLPMPATCSPQDQLPCWERLFLCLRMCCGKGPA